MLKRVMMTVAMTAALSGWWTAMAAAQAVGLATTKGGATEQIATALAKTISEKSGVMVRPQVMANTSQYLPLVDSGRVEFGIANFPQTAYAISGTGMSQGQPNPNLRMVASLIPFNAGLLVTAKSGLKTMADLKGKRVPRFPANSLGDFIIRASLQTAGLTYDDVSSVPIANFPAMFEALKDGLTDVTIATAGSQSVLDIDASVGGVTFLSYKPGDEKVLDENLPGTALKTGSQLTNSPGLTPQTAIFCYDYTLFASASASDETVAKVAKALYEGRQSLQASGPIWSEFDPARLAHVTKLAYHPGAIAFYKSVGIWSGQ
ncbi:TRAP transporter TAXI family solute receptor [Neorhizobium galegae]|uniref:TAXI family TRAP transporter solute-binding subunit n=1 Tax=Neorhizobium galegae TaxID=399 RepID=UPI001AE8A944|nr:TAXI family TRAP transporter solute-binding subunit [Neorhizobium galegae]MBP2550855.1 TRAP transporter TAXI family solute receptor [Neorhizobium galegae]